MPAALEQGLGRQPVVAFLRLGRHTALVGEPHFYAAPVNYFVGEQFVGAPRGGATAERQVGDAPALARALQFASDVGGGPARDGLCVDASRQAGHGSITAATFSAGA